ncbi:hypothetical protein MZTS_01075 [Methylorubrum zatmanii]|jgi:hypothetical protein|uniref:Uncharacterized protein n=1 Tax=Methylorubrum extorquens (strain ATCC 14718 / DSM 1338 / JCM 2805 / NCIMB 9133 / AM1) TaxID=272630 RepID=C5B3J3_METEA|nr:conserved hypothetical protein [Methylorubrum extorquens AM1]MBD8905340.1 hypothetical protein [Methylorubrum zatmanii]
MGCGLYDPAFATLGRLYGAEARPAITTLVLWRRFAGSGQLTAAGVPCRPWRMALGLFCLCRLTAYGVAAADLGADPAGTGRSS